MTTAIIQGAANIAGLGFNLSISRTDEGTIGQTPTCPKAWAGVLTDNAGVDAYITTTETHDIEVGDKITIYWSGGIGYYGDVTAVTGDTIVFNETTILGDAMPSAATAVIAAKEEEVIMGFDGDDVSMIATSVAGGARAHWQFLDVGDAVVHAQEVVADQPWFWADGMGWGTPITGNAITYAYVSMADITADRVVNLGVLYDSVA